jgi:predicted TIM-barrel fold metal-dependent hydrolase
VIVDTHVHIVAPDEEVYPLSPRPLSGLWYRKAPHSAEDLLGCMVGAGVDRAILVQPLGAYSFDNRYTADSAAAYPESFASACCVDVDGVDPVAALRYWVEERGMQGVRLFALSREPRSWLAEERVAPLWRCAADVGAHVIVTILGHQLGELRSALERYADTPVSLDHCAFPNLQGVGFAAAEPLFALADLPNLNLKLTTHVLDAAAEASGDPAPFVEALVQRFGAHRIMWGSDFCQIHDRPFAELVRLAHRAFATLTSADRALCLGGTARHLWPSLDTPVET